LVVIAIIGVLSVIIVPSVRSAQNKAKAAHFVAQVNQIEKAFLATYIDENRNDWWTESEIGIGNPTLENIINIETGALSGFSEYYNAEPSNYITSAELRYDNDGDTYTACSGSGSYWSGITLTFWDVKWELVDQVDRLVDPEPDGACGKIRHTRMGANDLCDDSANLCELKVSLDNYSDF